MVGTPPLHAIASTLSSPLPGNAMPATLLTLLAILTCSGIAAAIAWTRGRNHARSTAQTARDAQQNRIDTLASTTSQLSAQLRDLRATLDAAHAPLLVADTSGRIVLANPACEAFFEKPREALVGRTLENLFTHAQVLNAFTKARDGHPSDVQIRHAPPGGTLHTYLVNALPFQGDQPRILISLRDITQIAAVSQLRSDFVAAASHELRTPLASIRAATETLADGAWEDQPMRDRLVTITQSNIARLEHLLRDLLDLSRLEYNQNPQPDQVIDFGDFIQLLARDFEPLAAARNVSISTPPPERPINLPTQPRLLDLIFRNLIDNATKFAYPGTTIQILSDSPSPDLLRVRVIDQGAGIPLAHQQHIFERFYQADSARTGSPASTGDTTARRGTGLGLALARESATALGGTIAVQSIWKQGTTMTVELPLAAASKTGD